MHRNRLGLWLALSIALIALIGASPAGAAYLYFNSYGWDKTYRLNPTSGVNELVPASDILKAGFISAADVAADGYIYGGSSTDLYRVQIGGALAYWTKVATTSDSFNALCFDPSNQMYTASGNTLRKVSAGGQTISSVILTAPGKTLSIEGIDFSTGGTLYAIDTDTIYQVDPATGSAVAVATRPNLDGGIFTEMDVADDGIVRVLGSFNYLFQYNPSNGSAGWVPGELLYNGQSFSPSSLASGQVPEPGAIAPVGLALAILARRGRRMST